MSHIILDTHTHTVKVSIVKRQLAYLIVYINNIRFCVLATKKQALISMTSDNEDPLSNRIKQKKYAIVV
jgi:hypothetical protein